MTTRDRILTGLLLLGFVFLIVIPVLYRLNTLFNINRTYFWEEAPFYISACAAIIAGISVVMASRSAANSTKSLEIMRAIQRPFLQIFLQLFYGAIRDRAILTVSVKNTGNLPADCTTVSCVLYVITDDNNEERTLILEKPCSEIIFPSEKGETTYIIEGENEVEDLLRKEIQVKTMVNYRNRLTGEEHYTKRKYKVALGSLSPAINTYQPISMPNEDLWT